jgi:TonB-linked SusC/RagA family outer membrane protein
MLRNYKSMGNILFRRFIAKNKLSFRIINLVIFALFVVVGSPFAAELDLSREVTVISNNTTIGKVINDIGKQTGYLIVYNVNEVNLNRTVNVNVHNKPLKEALNQIFAGSDVCYVIEGRNIMLKKAAEDRAEVKKVQEPQQQEKKNKISGVVRDASGEPIIGANVSVKGTTIGTITDNEGKFEFKVPNSDGKLYVSYIGYEKRELSIDDKHYFTITLKENSNALNEVVVVGYGTQKKENLTGAVDHVTSKVFDGRANANVTQMLQGTIPNLNLKLTDGKPDRTATYNIRGTTSIGQGGSALVLIDGVEGDPSLINPNDIESVSVLKDASSAAIYGSRAPYGVVLITTKSAKSGTPQVNYSTDMTFASPLNVPQFVTDGYTYAEHFYEAWTNMKHSDPSGINKTQQFSVAWLNEYKARKEAGNFGTIVSDGSWGLTKGRWVYFNKSTDEMGLLYKKSLFTQTHNLSISGTDGKFEYYLSGRYYDYGGLFNSNTNTDNYSMFDSRVKVGYKVNEWMKITNNIDMSYTNYHNPITYSENSGNVWRNIADEGHPSSPLWNPDGTMTYSGVYSVGDLLYGKSYIKTVNDYVRNTVGINTHFFNNTLRVNGDFTYRNQNNSATTRCVRTSYSRTQGLLETISGTQSYMSENPINTIYLATNEYAEYENTFAKKHYVKALLGYNYEQEQTKGLYAYNDGLLTTDVDNINLALGTSNRNITGSWSKWRTAGGFFRLNYIFDERYLLEVDGRYDGSSKFPDGQCWSFFPSASAGWRLTSEPWFKINPKYISNLKLRASYGSLGNSNISPYSYDETFSVSQGRLIGGTIVPYTSAPSPKPSGLTWETARTANIGVDLGMFNNHLSVTADFYNRKTLNMYTPGPTLPDVYGATSPYGNFADMTTKGYEISVAWENSFNLAGNPLHYNVRATLADYYSIIDKYNNSTYSLGTSNTPNYYKGMKIGEIWGYVCNGLWQTQSEIDEAETKAKAAGQAYYNPLMSTDQTNKLYPGDIKIEDLNGNGYIDRGANTVKDQGDRRIIGNSEPRYIYSFNVGADWNGLFFSTLFRGVGKQKWYPSGEASYFWGQYNRPYNQLPKWQLGNYWTSDNTKAYLPRYTGYYGPFYSGSSCANTRYLQNVAYLRLQNLQIGYNLPADLIKTLGLRKLSVFFSGENLWTWSPLYKRTKDVDVTNIYGADVDAPTSGDGYNYPTMRSFSVGLNVTF